MSLAGTQGLLGVQPLTKGLQVDQSVDWLLRMNLIIRVLPAVPADAGSNLQTPKASSLISLVQSHSWKARKIGVPTP